MKRKKVLGEVIDYARQGQVAARRWRGNELLGTTGGGVGTRPGAVR